MKRAAPLQLDVHVGRSAAAVPRAAELQRWASAALGRSGSGREIALRLVGPTESRRLNHHYRGKDYATNVLSFPAQVPHSARSLLPSQPLGDIVLCPAVLRREARAQRKSARAHWAHLIVHGSLHLIGYDHERNDAARRMERREIAVLRALGFPNPYRPPVSIDP